MLRNVWILQTSASERRTLLAGFMGYCVDGFDFMIYSFVIPTLIVAWDMTRTEAGYIATASLVTSAIGGWVAGILADRFGRVRILQLTVLWFAAFACLSGFAHSYPQLMFTRGMQGLGFGGEWSVGSVLVSESLSARHRGRAAGLVQSSWAVGWGLAAVAFWAVYALAPPALGWRILFWIGIAPAGLILYIRRHVDESPLYAATRRHAGLGAGSDASWRTTLDIFRPPLLRNTLLASTLNAGLLAAYYSVTTWLPTYLQSERRLSVTGTAAYLLVLIAGSFAGYLCSAVMSDVLGRRRCFMVFAMCAAALVTGYLGWARSDAVVVLLGFPLGFFLSGVFGGMGAFLAELFPTRVRCSGQGFCYNSGRAFGAVAPALIGAASVHGSLGVAMATGTVGAYAIAVASAWALPETRGVSLR